jgi:tetratricopeptide (TPR) repeat protein
MRRSSIFFIFFAATLLSSACGRPPQNKPDLEVRAIFDEALRLDKEGRHHEALVRYETVLGRHPGFVSTRLNAALAAYDSGQYAKAVEHFNILRVNAPGDWFVLRKLIQCHERLGDEQKVAELRKELRRLRADPQGSLVLKRYKGFTRDFIPVGELRLIGYEFFEPKEHGRLWYFRLEDAQSRRRAAFLLESTPHLSPDGRRVYCLSETAPGYLRVWQVGPEGRAYEWTRAFVVEAIAGKKRPLLERPLPEDADVWGRSIPDGEPESSPENAKPSAAKEPAVRTDGGG